MHFWNWAHEVRTDERRRGLSVGARASTSASSRPRGDTAMRRCTDVVESSLRTALFPGHSASRFSRTPRAAAPSLHAGHAPGRGGDSFALPPHARDLAGGTECKAGQVRAPGRLPRLPHPVSPRARACSVFPSTSLHCPPPPSSARPPPRLSSGQLLHSPSSSTWPLCLPPLSRAATGPADHTPAGLRCPAAGTQGPPAAGREHRLPKPVQHPKVDQGGANRT
jgi:hypothetical protein